MGQKTNKNKNGKGDKTKIKKMEKYKEEHITLFAEEVDSLNNFKEICIYENEDKKIKVFIKFPFVKELKGGKEKIKTDEELLKIWDNKEKSSKDWWIYGRLNSDEKMRLFDLIEYRKPIINKKLKLKEVLK